MPVIKIGCPGPPPPPPDNTHAHIHITSQSYCCHGEKTSGEEAANVCSDGSRGQGGGCVARVDAAQGVVFNCARRGKSEKRAIRGWGTAAQSS